VLGAGCEQLTGGSRPGLALFSRPQHLRAFQSPAQTLTPSLPSSSSLLTQAVSLSFVRQPIPMFPTSATVKTELKDVATPSLRPSVTWAIEPELE